MYNLLWLIVISALLGFFLGLFIFNRALNWAMSCGTMDIYVKGTKLERLRMW